MKQEFKLLYKTGKAGENFSKLSPADKSGKEEEIQKFFEKDLTKIFPKIKLFIFEKNEKTTTKYKFKGGQLDAIGWIPQGRFFVIFEYKSQNLSLTVEQIIRYLDTFSNENGEVCRDLLDDLNKKFPKSEGVMWKHKDIEWKTLKLVWIAPNLPYKKNWIPRTTWVESEWYENCDEKAVKLWSKDEEGLLKQLSNEEKENQKPKEVKITKKEIKNLSQLLEEIKPSKEVEKWSKEIHKIATEEFYLNLEIHPNPRWRWLFYKKDNQTLFWNFISKKYKRITIYFANADENKFLLERHALKETPTIFKWVVNDEESFAKALLLLRDFWQWVKNKK